MSGQFNEGEAVKLPVSMEIFPAPKNEDFEWTIEEPGTGNEIKIVPGNQLLADT